MVATVSVVVLLAVIIATITRAVLADEQPATTAAPPDRDGGSNDVEPHPGDQAGPLLPGTGHEGSAPAAPAADAPASQPAEPSRVPEGVEGPIYVPAGDLRVAGRTAVAVAPDEGRSLLARVRAVVLLALLIVALGAVAAVVLGAVIVGGAALLDQALS